jgi:predicted site-specific integrase-resolvase
MEEMSKHGQIGNAAMKAGMDRKTARRYVADGKLPSEKSKTRDWRPRGTPKTGQSRTPENRPVVAATPGR